MFLWVASLKKVIVDKKIKKRKKKKTQKQKNKKTKKQTKKKACIVF